MNSASVIGAGGACWSVFSAAMSNLPPSLEFSARTIGGRIESDDAAPARDLFRSNGVVLCRLVRLLRDAARHSRRDDDDAFGIPDDDVAGVDGDIGAADGDVELDRLQPAKARRRYRTAVVGGKLQQCDVRRVAKSAV